MTAVATDPLERTSSARTCWPGRDSSRAGRSFGQALSAFFALILLTGCGGPPESTPPATSSLYDLSGVPLSAELAPAVAAARATLDEPDPDTAALRQLRACEALRASFSRKAESAAAQESLRVWWERDPTHFLWIREAAFQRYEYEDQATLERLRARPALSDTTRGPGAYAASQWFHGAERPRVHLARAMECWDDLDSLQQAVLVLSVGSARGRDEDAIGAVRFLLLHLSLARAVGGRLLEAQFWQLIGQNLERADRLDDAVHAHVTGWELSRAARDTGREERSMRLLAGTLCARQENAAGRELLERCAEIAVAQDLPAVRSFILDRLASLATTRGDFRAALSHDLLAHELLVQTAERHNLPMAAINIANDYRFLGELDSCRTYAQKALRYAQEYGSERLIMGAMQRAAVFHVHFGEYATAESLLTTALALAEQHSVVYEEVRLLVEVLRESLQMGLIDMAYLAVQRLRQIESRLQDDSPNENLRAQFEVASADLYRRQGEYRLASDALKRAALAIEARPGAEWEWEYHRSRGELARERDDHLAAQTEFERCLALAEEVGNADWITATRFDLARTYLDTGQYARARETLPRAEDPGLFGARFRTRLETLAFRGATLRREGVHEDAIESLREAQDLLTEHSVPELAARIKIELATALLSARSPRQGEARPRESEVQPRESEARPREVEVQPRESEARLREVETLLWEALHALRSERLHGGRDALRGVGDHTRRDAVEALIALRMDHPDLWPPAEAAWATLALAEEQWWSAPDRGGPTSGPQAERIESWRAMPGCQVAFFIGTERAFRWTVAGGRIEVAELPQRQALIESLRPVLGDLRTPHRPFDPDAMRALGRTLLGSLIPMWAEGTTLRILPDGPLFRVPWAAVVLEPGRSDGDGDVLVLDHGPVVEIASLSQGHGAGRFGKEGAVGQGAAAGQGAGVGQGAAAGQGAGVGQGAGGPHGAGTQGALLATGLDGLSAAGDGSPGEGLRHAEAEAEAVADLWAPRERRVLVGSDARWERWSEMDLTAYAAIHIATHAVIHHGQGMPPSIRLAGEGDEAVPLTVAAVKELVLDAQLVYLSCCEAAARHSEGRGLRDFASAFLAAGARTVIAATERIEDQAARYMAERFYESWLSGATKAEALRRAQQATRQQPQWAHPYYWASYRIMGCALREPSGRSEPARM